LKTVGVHESGKGIAGSAKMKTDRQAPTCASRGEFTCEWTRSKGGGVLVKKNAAVEKKKKKVCKGAEQRVGRRRLQKRD